jgi:hypothetical protein
MLDFLSNILYNEPTASFIDGCVCSLKYFLTFTAFTYLVLLYSMLVLL